MNPHLPSSKTVIYQTKAGSLELKTDVGVETIWLTQDQTATLFDVQKAAISKHMKNIFAIGELTPEATVSKMETVQKEGSRIIKRTISYYNLDLVLSIGYRVNSKNATHFRQWATKILKQHIQEGYTINRNRIGAYAFIWLLRQAKILDLTRITPQTLTALTILIAESNPQDKEKMIGLVCTLLAKKKHKQL